MEKEQDILYQTAKFYKEKLSSRHYEIKIQKANREEQIEIRFFPESFYHLVGLHKLKDIPQVQRSARKVFQEILSGKITSNDIVRSQYFTEMEDRLQHHEEIFNIFSIRSIFFKALHKRFKGVTADCVICGEIPDSKLYSFLFFIHSRESFLNPVSFFTRNENKEYTKDGVRWKVVSVADVTPSPNVR